MVDFKFPCGPASKLRPSGRKASQCAFVLTSVGLELGKNGSSCWNPLVDMYVNVYIYIHIYINIYIYI